MGAVAVIKGNIFASQCQTLVNTVNCEGVMGAGIALEFKLRHPEMFEQYAAHCRAGRIDIGKLWIYQPPAEAGDGRWVLNFPTKRRWKDPSRLEYLVSGLEKFAGSYHRRGVQSAAFPVLGSANGGLPEEASLAVMLQYLEPCEIPVEIYRYDATYVDDLYADFKRRFLRMDDRETAAALGLRINLVRKVRETLEREHQINSISRLASVRGIGAKTLEKSFRYIMEHRQPGDTGAGLPPGGSESENEQGAALWLR